MRPTPAPASAFSPSSVRQASHASQSPSSSTPYGHGPPGESPLDVLRRSLQESWGGINEVVERVAPWNRTFRCTG